MIPKGYRRLFFVVVTLVITSLALFTKYMTGPQFVEYLQWLGGFYIGSDVAEKSVAGVVAIWKKPSESPHDRPSEE